MGLHLGRNHPKSAKKVLWVSMGVSTAIAFVVGALFFVGKNELGHIYSDDPKIWVRYIFNIFYSLCAHSQGTMCLGPQLAYR